MLGEILENQETLNKLDIAVSSENVIHELIESIDKDKQAQERLNKILDKYSKDKEDNSLDDFFLTNQPKRLKKTKLIQKQKKIKKLLNLNAFFEYEAELGSDNEQHDDVVKKVDRDDNDDFEDDNEDLKDLIANEYEEDKEDIKEKFFNDMLDKDKEEISKVIRGPELRLKRSRTDIKPDIDHLPLDMRLKRFKSSDDTLYSFNQDILFRNLESNETIDEEENYSNDEIKEMYKSYESNVIKKVVEQSKGNLKLINNRMVENNKILENVINLNQLKEVKKDIKLTSAIISKINLQKFGCFYNRNSILHAINNDKDYGCNEVKEDEVEKPNDKNNFSKSLNVKSALYTKSNNLSSLFKQNSVIRNINETKRLESNSSGKKGQSLRRILN
jgi:hypothetical protein